MALGKEEHCSANMVYPDMETMMRHLEKTLTAKQKRIMRPFFSMPGYFGRMCHVCGGIMTDDDDQMTYYLLPALSNIVGIPVVYATNDPSTIRTSTAQPKRTLWAAAKAELNELSGKSGQNIHLDTVMAPCLKKCSHQATKSPSLQPSRSSLSRPRLPGSEATHEATICRVLDRPSPTVFDWQKLTPYNKIQGTLISGLKQMEYSTDTAAKVVEILKSYFGTLKTPVVSRKSVLRFVRGHFPTSAERGPKMPSGLMHRCVEEALKKLVQFHLIPSLSPDSVRHLHSVEPSMSPLEQTNRICTKVMKNELMVTLTQLEDNPVQSFIDEVKGCIMEEQVVSEKTYECPTGPAPPSDMEEPMKDDLTLYETPPGPPPSNSSEKTTKKMCMSWLKVPALNQKTTKAGSHGVLGGERQARAFENTDLESMMRHFENTLTAKQKRIMRPFFSLPLSLKHMCRVCGGIITGDDQMTKMYYLLPALSNIVGIPVIYATKRTSESRTSTAQPKRTLWAAAEAELNEISGKSGQNIYLDTVMAPCLKKCSHQATNSPSLQPSRSSLSRPRLPGSEATHEATICRVLDRPSPTVFDWQKLTPYNKIQGTFISGLKQMEYSTDTAAKVVEILKSYFGTLKTPVVSRKSVLRFIRANFPTSAERGPKMPSGLMHRCVEEALKKLVQFHLIPSLSFDSVRHLHIEPSMSPLGQTNRKCTKVMKNEFMVTLTQLEENPVQSFIDEVKGCIMEDQVVSEKPHECPTGSVPPSDIKQPMKDDLTLYETPPGPPTSNSPIQEKKMKKRFMAWLKVPALNQKTTKAGSHGVLGGEPQARAFENTASSSAELQSGDLAGLRGGELQSRDALADVPKNHESAGPLESPQEKEDTVGCCFIRMPKFRWSFKRIMKIRRGRKIERQKHVNSSEDGANAYDETKGSG
ncbi:uncharacterized protein LOC134442637 [Engraulis encrasicolus]|uniref:uncharacterized protein LOC134442637 n=1 Tax=Engraulis encrasicolus TaxID=184585 RepID=UPI002FD393DF